MKNTPILHHSNTELPFIHYTLNRWWGCSHCSPACDNCYAEGIANWLKKPLGLWSGHHWILDYDTLLAKARAWNTAAAKHVFNPIVFLEDMGDIMENSSDLVASRKEVWKLIEETPS